MGTGVGGRGCDEAFTISVNDINNVMKVKRVKGLWEWVPLHLYNISVEHSGFCSNTTDSTWIQAASWLVAAAGGSSEHPAKLWIRAKRYYVCLLDSGDEVLNLGLGPDHNQSAKMVLKSAVFPSRSWKLIIQPAREARGPEGPARWER